MLQLRLLKRSGSRADVLAASCLFLALKAGYSSTLSSPRPHAFPGAPASQSKLVSSQAEIWHTCSSLIIEEAGGRLGGGPGLPRRPLQLLRKMRYGGPSSRSGRGFSTVQIRSVPPPAPPPPDCLVVDSTPSLIVQRRKFRSTPEESEIPYISDFKEGSRESGGWKSLVSAGLINSRWKIVIKFGRRRLKEP